VSGAPEPCGLTLPGPDDGFGPRRRERSWDRLLGDLATVGSDLTTDLRALDVARGEVPSLCTGWSVRDVVVHLVVGDDLALRALDGERPLPEPTDDDTVLQDLAVRLVREQGDIPLGEAIGRYADRRRELLAALGRLSEADLGEEVPWAATAVSRRALVQSRLMETWIHGWDVRRPLGIAQPFDDRVWWVCDLAVRTLPYAFAKERRRPPAGTVRVELGGPGGGVWERRLPGGAEGTVRLAGPSWAWLVLAGRRDVRPDLARAALTVDPADAACALLDPVRAFA
jgi:uncharacterized protein (TIGR03084 family)